MMANIDKQVERAWQNRNEIIACRHNLEKNCIQLGYLFKVNRDEGLYKLLGYDSFEEFLGDPEISFRRSKVYGLIRIYELYIEKLLRPIEELIQIGNAKLLDICPVVEQNPDEWLSKAASLSRSDLKNEIREARGLPEKIPAPPKEPPQKPPFPGLPSSFFDIVKASDCCVCGKSPVDYAHFPITEATGGEFGIPLCRQCHQEYHQDPKEWTWTYRRQWSAWIKDLINNLLNDKLY